MTARTEAPVSADLLRKILELAGTEMILVGGQALAFWAAYYEVPAPAAAITKDVDLIGTRADVKRLARGLGGEALFAKRSGLTLLTGQVLKTLPGGDYVNIDVMFRIYGHVTAKALGERAVPAENAAGRFRVMHPVDVLQSRLENVYGLEEKQDEHGIAQLQLAIGVARRFISDVASQEAAANESPRPVALRHLARIEKMARSDAGRKVAKRFAVFVADAIDPTPVRHVKQFVSKKLPRLLPLMSPGRRAEVTTLR